VHATVTGAKLEMRAQVFEPGVRTGNAIGASDDPEGVARALMHLIYG
jgi:hypothetical protein